MVITYHGGSCFRIQSGPLSLVADPASERFKSDIRLKTAAAYPPEESDAKTVIGAGEYEVGGVGVHGVQLAKESSDKTIKTAYIAKVEDINLGFLGEISHIPEPSFYESFHDIDILFVPVGGKPYLEPEEAAKVIKQIKPRIVIPSLYKSPRGFLEEMGQKAVPQEKLTVKKKDLIEGGEKTRVVCLTV